MRFSVKKVTLSSFFPPKTILISRYILQFLCFSFLSTFILKVSIRQIMHIRNNGAPNQQWVDNKRTDRICSSWGRPELILYTAWSGSPEFQSGSYTPDQNISPPWLESSHNPLRLHCYRNWVYFLGCPAKNREVSINISLQWNYIQYSIQMISIWSH